MLPKFSSQHPVLPFLPRYRALYTFCFSSSTYDDGQESAALSVVLKQAESQACLSPKETKVVSAQIPFPGSSKLESDTELRWLHSLLDVDTRTGWSCMPDPSTPFHKRTPGVLPSSRIKARGIKNSCNSILNAIRKRLYLRTTKSCRLWWGEQHVSDQQAVFPLCRAPSPKMSLGKVAQILPTPREPLNTCFEACSRFTINI